MQVNSLLFFTFGNQNRSRLKLHLYLCAASTGSESAHIFIFIVHPPFETGNISADTKPLPLPHPNDVCCSSNYKDEGRL